IEAMKLAITAGAPGDETTAWCRIQLGKLYELIGDWKTASMHYTIALSERPGYAYALAGLGRVAKNNNEYDKAIGLYQLADAQLIGYTFKEELAELYLLSGQKEKALAIENEIIDRMTNDAASGATDERIGHYADMELAYAFLKKNDYEKALFHALQEYNRRPNNIDINEALAWVYYQRADYEKAVTHLKTALKTNSKHPRLLCRAGLIYGKAGDITKAKQFLNEGLKSTASIDRNLKIAGEDFLKTH
ncbi:MAG: tetratricopeptide repeat protein, partial [Chitinophagaceae bacterium]